MNTLSGVLFFVAFLPYAWAILNGQTAPSPVSWGIWAVVDTLTFFAMKKKGAKLGQITGGVAGVWIITLLAIFFGQPAMGSIEWVSIAGALIGIALWKKTGDAVLAIICAQAATFIGTVPTFVGAYQNPSKEDPLAWCLWLASCICALLAIKKWDLANALQPLTFTAIETIMVILVVIVPFFR